MFLTWPAVSQISTLTGRSSTSTTTAKEEATVEGLRRYGERRTQEQVQLREGRRNILECHTSTTSKSASYFSGPRRRAGPAETRRQLLRPNVVLLIELEGDVFKLPDKNGVTSSQSAQSGGADAVKSPPSGRGVNKGEASHVQDNSPSDRMLTTMTHRKYITVSRNGTYLS
ncbi:hypothetical protein EVAR_102843_1 [Eumeta japonica]|uniref:Uncharacterized protein n=1 Tax=Eumeta variegata TaxID=151549 RepID=A0A4C1UMC6_EUMVA|nr:hypothetical protein EVAR_102843_1 [Eumeta japonica]